MSSRPRCDEALAVLGTHVGHSDDALRRARAHAAMCPECSAWFDDETHRPAQRASASANLLRGAILTAAVLQIVIAVPWLFGHSVFEVGGHAARDHLTRDGALGVIAGLGGLVAALRARASLPMMWLCIAVTSLQFVTGAVDDADHHVNLHFEATHTVLILIAVLVALLVRAQRPPVVARHAPPRLRAVPDDAGSS